MAERHLIVDHLKFSYEGLFSASELYSLIVSFFFEKGWDWVEKMNEEQITPQGKQIRLVLEPYKGATDYHKLLVKIKVNMIDVKEVEIEKNGEKLKLDHGVVRITFDGYVLSDRKNIWANKPFYWLLSYILEKYFYRRHYLGMERWIESDIEDLHQKIKSYLNVFKYTYGSKEKNE